MSTVIACVHSGYITVTLTATATAIVQTTQAVALATGKLKVVVVVVNQQYPPTKVTNVALAIV